MPMMDGYEASQKIIQILGDDSPSIIAMTANVLEKDKLYMKECGMRGVISKPINPVNLFDIIQSQLTMDKKSSFIESSSPAVDYPVLIDYGKYSNVLNSLKEVGVDTDFALPNVSGDVHRYYSLLFKYINDLKEKVSQLEKTIFLDDSANRKKICHNMKGVSLNLGIVEVGKLLGMMEEEYDRSILSFQLQRLISLTKKIERKLYDIRQYETLLVQDEKSELKRDYRAILMDVLPLLKLGDLSCLDYILELRHYSENQQVIVLIDQIESMDFRLASETVANILNNQS
ncbi:hypothetical protein O1D97_03370 [Marinomonas sp. 15G1-11]|uniref:Uncharacterized protein n=1 Tax=Marinomonas phaeophyticola TaxID=3004091 RepID=A0ABT4JQV0_9GAMM|nr:hypothetical protein [Marinomonas sp. 15G1-11]MCZ2720709.1 hypothetical protein [Marinomonas sp. 15G1-11]